MTDEILPLGYPPKTRRVCQPYIDQIAALSARLADAEAALATARDALKIIARGNSLIFNTNPQQMSGEEARGVARAALAQEGGG